MIQFTRLQVAWKNKNKLQSVEVDHRDKMQSSSDLYAEHDRLRISRNLAFKKARFERKFALNKKRGIQIESKAKQFGLGKCMKMCI